MARGDEREAVAVEFSVAACGGDERLRRGVLRGRPPVVAETLPVRFFVSLGSELSAHGAQPRERRAVYAAEHVAENVGGNSSVIILFLETNSSLQNLHHKCCLCAIRVFCRCRSTAARFLSRKR